MAADGGPLFHRGGPSPIDKDERLTLCLDWNGSDDGSLSKKLLNPKEFRGGEPGFPIFDRRCWSYALDDRSTLFSDKGFSPCKLCAVLDHILSIHSLRAS